MQKVKSLAIFILAVMFIMMLGSVWNESGTMDELAHIPAGFGYVTQLDYRLNPEHPPLLKAVSALFAQIAVRPYFPTNTPYWQIEPNGQWAQGGRFLYDSGNDPDAIIFWSRMPFILLSVFFGWLIFIWTRGRFGPAPALMTLILFASSPTILAHSRYVTTDLGASFGFFIGVISYISFLEKPTWRNTAIAGILFGIAELLKFSLILLLPIYGIMLLGFIWSQPNLHWHERFRILGRLFGKTILIGSIGLILISAVYALFTWNYPARSLHPVRSQTPEASADMQAYRTSNGTSPDGSYWTRQELTALMRLPEPDRTETIKQIPLSQMRDSVYLLSSFAGGPDYEEITCSQGENVKISRRIRCLAEFTIRTTEWPVLRPLGQYLLGLLMVIQRSAGGNTAYFLGEVSAAGSRLYFPLLYLLKEHLAFHILTILALWFGLQKILKSLMNNPDNFLTRGRAWINAHFAEFSALTVIIVYWASSIKSPLNIGIRHVLPTFPFIFILVSRQITDWLHFHEYASPTSFLAVLKNIWQIWARVLPKYFLVGFLFFWMIINVFLTFPHFLAYYNELAGGTPDGYLIATDSNYDWCQDLKRLRDYVEANGIEKIAVDYFGAGNPRYYLGDKFESWWSAKGAPSGYFAISATFLQGATAVPAPGFVRRPEDSYEWLKGYEPIGRAGYSIFIYKLP